MDEVCPADFVRNYLLSNKCRNAVSSVCVWQCVWVSQLPCICWFCGALHAHDFDDTNLYVDELLCETFIWQWTNKNAKNTHFALETFLNFILFSTWRFETFTIYSWVCMCALIYFYLVLGNVCVRRYRMSSRIMFDKDFIFFQKV